MTTHVQTFRTEMAHVAESYAEMYNLDAIVDPEGLLQPAEKSSAISRYCEEILNPTKWRTCYLHEIQPITPTQSVS